MDEDSNINGSTEKNNKKEGEENGFPITSSQINSEIGECPIPDNHENQNDGKETIMNSNDSSEITTKEKKDDEISKLNDNASENESGIEKSVITEQNNKKIDELDVYNLVIDINGMKSLLDKGWPELSKKKGKEIYEAQKDKRSVVVSVIGNANKGKSFFLTKISDIKLPSGFSVTTRGLSVKYPEIKNKNIILLDTAGFETPLVENSVYKLSKDKFKLDENTYYEESKILARDRQMTEYFLQKFVLTQANIVVCLVGQLTYNEQKFLSKITEECGEKQLFIIHNLQNLEKKHDVEKYIKEILKCSLTFKLKENKIIDFNEKSKNKDENNIYYTEIFQGDNEEKKFGDNKNEKDIVHLIMAREGSEAGNYYNNSTIQYIKNQIIAFIGVEVFPIEEKLKDFLFQISKEIMEKGIESKDEIQIIESNNNQSEKENQIEVIKSIKLVPKNNKEYKLKKYLIDELGSNIFEGTTFKPKYRYYKDKENKKFIIEIAMCGGLRGLKCKPINLGENYRFHFEGFKTFDTINPKVEKSEPQYLKNERKNGNFSFDIIVPTDDVILSENKYSKVEKNYGIITFEFNLFQTEDDEQKE